MKHPPHKPALELKAMIGFASKSRDLVPGAELSLMMLKKNEAAVILLDESASENTVKRLENACQYREIPIHCLEAGFLGSASGKAGMLAAAVKNGKLGEKIINLLHDYKSDSI